MQQNIFSKCVSFFFFLKKAQCRHSKTVNEIEKNGTVYEQDYWFPTLLEAETEQILLWSSNTHF